MSKQRRRRQHRHSARGPAAPATPATPFTPVALRPRHDGWTPARQEAFIRTLAECANVEGACAAVGMSPRSAYTLRPRADAGSFRQAWDAALDYGVARLEDAMLGRAPERYGKWREGLMEKREHPDGAAIVLQRAIRDLAEDNLADEAGRPRPDRPPLRRVYLADDPAEQEAMEEERQRADAERRNAEFEAYLDTLRRQTGQDPSGEDYGGSVARTS